MNLAKLVMAIKPKGGTICIQSGGAAAANHNERMQGIRDTLAGKPSSAQAPGDRLTGQNGWKEVDGCPLYTNDDFPRGGAADGGHPRQVSASSMRSCRPAASRSSCRRPTARWPRSTSRGSTTDRWRLVVADTLPVQIELLKAGLSRGQVGQRPFEMGYKTMFFLKDIKDGKPEPKDPTYTGLDVCTPQNVATCIGK